MQAPTYTSSPNKNISKKVKVKWTDVEHNSFILMKEIVVHDVLLSYPEFSGIFIIHTDASKLQIGVVIS